MLEASNNWIRRHPHWAGALLSLITYVVFCGTLSNLFVHDDIPQVLENPFLSNAGMWTRIFTGSVWSFRGPAQHDNMYRPLQFAVYWLLYRVAGPHPGIYHLFMLLFYAAAVWLVFRLALRLIPSPAVAFAGALLWALHPLHVETVAWVSALPDLGAAFFYVLGFLLFLRSEDASHRPLLHHLLAAAGFLPALFFKEMALSLPLLLIVYWWYLPGKSTLRTKLVSWVPYALAVAVYLVIRKMVLGRISEASHLFAISWRLVVGAAALLGQHARLFLWPVQLSLFRSFHLATALHSAWPEIAVFIVLGALCLRRREPLFGFLIIWWGVTLAPCLDIRQVNNAVADRFSLLPSVGLCLAAALLALGWLPRHWGVLQNRRVLVPALGVVMVLWTVQDVRSVRSWHDNVSLWNQAYAAAPDSAVAHMLRGALLQQRDGKLAEAAEEYRVALQLNAAGERPLPGVTAECSVLLGEVANLQGHPEEAIRDYNQALRAVPGYSMAYKALGIVYFPRGDYAQAAKYFRRAVELNPQEAETRFYLGTCYLKLEQPRAAAEQFHAAREADASYTEAYQEEARALEAAGDKDGAAHVRALLAQH